MRVLVYSSGADTGGQGWRLEGAFRRYTGWHVEAHNGSRGTLGFPEWHPLPLIERKAEIARQYDAADVVHLRNNLSGWTAFDKGQCKPVVIHYHGTAFRESPKAYAAQARQIGAVQVAATLDLTLLAPDVEWVPSPYDLAWLASMREAALRDAAPGVSPGERLPPSSTVLQNSYSPRREDMIRIAHFPTNERIKSTRAFLAAVDRLRERHRIELVTNLVRGKVRNIPWADVMEAKAGADILYDQVLLGIGNNALEAMGMGIPVVAGVRDPKVRALMVQTWGTLPFMEATEDTIEQALEALIASRELRDEYSARGLAYVTRWHDDAKVVAQLQGIYASAPPTHKVTLPGTPGWLARRQETAA